MKLKLNSTTPTANRGNFVRSIVLICGLVAATPNNLWAQALTDGGNHDGTILLNQTNTWTFSATIGDRIVLRGAALTSTNSFNPWLRIYNPVGTLIADSGSNDGNMTAEEVTLTATNSGTFTATINDSGYVSFNGTGAYRLYFAQSPGAFIVPAGDEGGPLTNGGNHDGTIQLGDLDLWSFTASAGDRVVLRMGALTSTGSFNPWLRVYGPNGVLVADSGINDGNMTAEEVTLTVTNGGSFTVLVSDSQYNYFGGTGTYRLYFAQSPETFIVPAGDEGGPLTNGGNHDGTIQLGDLDLWSFTANAGDRVVLRMGALTSTNSFNPWLRVYGPNGVLIADSGINDGNMTAEEVTLTVTNGGSFTVLVSDSQYNYFGGTGTYRLYFAQSPETFIVPAGDEGGPLTNGGNHDGTIQLGDLDLWSFTANVGDRVVLRMGALTSTGSFNPWLRVYGPNGVLVADSGINDGNMTAEEVTLTVTNGGSFTVLVSDSQYNYFGGTGTYRLYFAQSPETFIVPAGDEGGSLTRGVNPVGTILLGDLDLWRFTACAGDLITLTMDRLSTTNSFNPWLRLYGPSGALVGDSGINNANAVSAQITLTAPSSGNYTVLASDSQYNYFGGTGTYQLTSNGLYDGLKFCIPRISGVNVVLSAIGGTSGANAVLYSSTNVATPFALWSPIQTNQFDQFGVLTATTPYNASVPNQFFRLVVP